MQDCSNGCEVSSESGHWVSFVGIRHDLLYLGPSISIWNDQARWEFMFTYSTNLRGTSHSDIKYNAAGSVNSRRGGRERLVHFDSSHSLIDSIFQFVLVPDRQTAETTQKRYWATSIMGSSIWTSHQKVPSHINLSIHAPTTSFVHLQIFKNVILMLEKTYFYKKTRVEKYAPYSTKDGIVLKVSEFADYDCKWRSVTIQKKIPQYPFGLSVKELIYVTQRYEHRHDKLEVREHDVRTNTVYENYHPGRCRSTER